MTTPETIQKPEGLTDEHLVWLDDLRRSNKMNMFAAAPSLGFAFDLTRQEANDYLSYWMKTYSARKGKQP